MPQLDPNASHFYRSPHWKPGITYCSDNALARMRAGLVREPEVSRTLAFFDGSFAVELIRAFFIFAEVAFPPADAEMWVGSEWLSATGSRRPGDRRSPDIIITSRHDPRIVLLIIELKGNAWTNGGDRYCPIHCDVLGFSNQTICYLSDCWTTVDLSEVSRLIIGPDVHRGVNGGWGHKGIRPVHVSLNGKADAFNAQQDASSKWHFAGLRELKSCIEEMNTSSARTDALEVLGCWMDRNGL